MMVSEEYLISSLMFFLVVLLHLSQRAFVVDISVVFIISLRVVTLFGTSQLHNVESTYELDVVLHLVQITDFFLYVIKL